MSILISFIFCFIFLASGYAVSHIAFYTEKNSVCLWLGGVIGLLMLIVLPSLWAIVFDFTAIAQYLALTTCIVIGFTAVFYCRKNNVKFKAPELKTIKPLVALLPIFIIGIYLFSTHTIPEKNGALYVGQSTFGDLAMHLGIVSSIAEQQTFPPMYSILYDTPIGYPFLCDSVSSTFYVLGAPLRFSMLLPSVWAFALVLLGVYMFFESWLKEHPTTVLSVLLFFIGGGFGFAYFFDILQKSPDNITRIFTDFYTTPTNYVDKGMLWVNPVADMLVPQRATLFGWALLFPALYLLRRAAFEDEHKLFIPLGIIASCMPLVHTHSFLALGILSAFYLAYDLLFNRNNEKLKCWILYGGIVLILAFPQLFLFTFKQSEGFLRFNFNWVNSTDCYLWFYIKNLGLFFILLPLSFLNLDKKEKLFYGGALLIWFIAEFIQFQPNPYDNNKLLFVWFAFTCGITAKLLVKLYRQIKDIKGREFIAAVVLFVFFTSGVLTLGREVVSEYQLISAPELEAAEFIKQNTEPDSLFLTATNHNNLVAALTGRNIICGSSSYVYFVGLDYSEHENNLTLMYSQPEIYFEDLSEQYGIDYVLFSSYERNEYPCDEKYFSERYPVSFDNDNVKIYKIR